MEKIEKLKKKLSNTLLLLKNVYQCIKTNFLPARNCDKTKNKCFMYFKKSRFSSCN